MKLPEIGYIFWPVGTGDSTTIILNSDTFLQVDMNHLGDSSDEDDPHAPIVNILEEYLPEVDGKPYLSVFALTHPDEDHCKGFSDLLSKVVIGELWFTPRIFREFKKDLCDDAEAFLAEANRRVKKAIKNGGDLESGDRLRVIGFDELLQEDEFSDFPEELLTIPGNSIAELDGEDRSDVFNAFIHSPFKEDSCGERNETSLSMQVILKNETSSASVLLFGDLCYPTIMNIFDKSEDADLAWNILLAPHHCSKCVMYWKDEGEEDEKLKNDILDLFEKASLNPGYIIASSEPIPTSNESGDNPPHAKAKNRYEEIVPNEFICTQEHPNQDNPQPIVFSLGSKGLEYKTLSGKKKLVMGGLAAAAEKARGQESPPTDRVGFGIN